MKRSKTDLNRQDLCTQHVSSGQNQERVSRESEQNGVISTKQPEACTHQLLPRFHGSTLQIYVLQMFRPPQRNASQRGRKKSLLHNLGEKMTIFTNMYPDKAAGSLRLRV